MKRINILKYITALLAALLMFSCGDNASSTDVKTETITKDGLDLSTFTTEMKVSAGRETFWKLVDATAINDNTFETKTFQYSDGKYNLPSLTADKYQIMMEALNIEEIPIARGISSLIDIDNLENKYFIYMVPLNKSISITASESGIDETTKNLEGHTVTALPDGRVLILGGKDATGFTSKAFIYMPDTQTVQALHDNGIKRAFHTATLYYTDKDKKHPKILISGGKSTSGYIGTSEIFNPEDNTLTQIGDQLLAAKANQAAVYTPKGFIYFFGGVHNDTEYNKDVIVFNTYGNSYSILPVSLNFAVENVTATYLGGEKIIIAGGNNANSVYGNVYSFDSELSTINSLGNLTTKRTMHSAVMHNGSVYFIGGFSNITGTTFSEPVNTVEQADSLAVNTANLCLMNKARGRFTTNFVNVNTVIITGGDNGDKTPIKESEIIELKSQSCIVSQRNISLNAPRHSSKSVLTSNGLTVIVGGTATGLSSDATPIEIMAVDPRY